MQVDTQQEVKVRRCVKCGQKLDAANKDRTCRNTAACNTRAENLRVSVVIPKEKQVLYDFTKGSIAWHLVRAVAAHYNRAVDDLSTLGSDHDSTRIKAILTYLLRQDAKLTNHAIEAFLDIKSTSSLNFGYKKVELNFPTYRDEVLAIREHCKKDMGDTYFKSPKSVLVVA